MKLTNIRIPGFIVIPALIISALTLGYLSHDDGKIEDPRDNAKEHFLFKFRRSAPKVGDKAPPFELSGLDGNNVGLAQLIKDGPAVLEFGNYTCKPFQAHSASMELLKQKYADKVKFAIIYTRESNPGSESFINIADPASFPERVTLANSFVTQFHRTCPVLVDEMDNAVCYAYGNPYNAAYIIDSDGTIVFKQAWAPPAEIDRRLACLLGEQGFGSGDNPSPCNPPRFSRIKMKISPMVSNECVIAVRNALLACPGVRYVKIILPKGIAFVEYGQNVTDRQKLIKAVEDVGYHGEIK